MHFIMMTETPGAKNVEWIGEERPEDLTLCNDDEKLFRHDPISLFTI